VHGCSPEPLADATYEGEEFFWLSGPVVLDDPPPLAPAAAAVAWVWQEAEQAVGLVQIVPLESRILGYGIEVNRPPGAAEFDDNTWVPVDSVPLPAGVSLLYGLPLLLTREPSEGDALVVDPAEMARWVAWDQFDAGAIVRMDGAGGDPLVGVTRGHLLVLMASDAAVRQLSEFPSFDNDGGCVIGSVIPGLTLYRRDTEDCARWEPLAQAGERTEFQGIPMRDTDAGSF